MNQDDHPSNACTGGHIPVQGRPDLCHKFMADQEARAVADEQLALRHGAAMTREEAKADAENALRGPQEPVAERLYADEEGVLTIAPEGVGGASATWEEPESILEEAQRIIHGQRQQDYGGPLESFERISALWSAYLGVPLAAEDAANLLILLKVARAKQGFHRDSYVDVAGYAGCAELIQRERGAL